MRTLVRCKEEDISHLMQYANSIQSIGDDYWIAVSDVSRQTNLMQVAIQAEAEFDMALKTKRGVVNDSYFRSKNILFVFMGSKQSQADSYYDIAHHKEYSMERKKHFPYHFMNVYCLGNTVTSIDYLKAVKYAIDKSAALNKPLLIYTDIDIETSKYKHSLIKEVIDHLMVKGERGKDKGFIQATRQNESLYSDLFYETIPPDEEIYVTLDVGFSKSRQFFEGLGIRYYTIFRDYGVLQATKRIFDENALELMSQVIPQYTCQTLTQQKLNLRRVEGNFNYNVSGQNLRYKGKGTYIGIISTSGIDYTHPAFLTEEGGSRIGYIWEQTNGNEGISYYEEDINRALASPNPREIVPIDDTTGTSTLLLGIAGGYTVGEGQTYRGLATEAQFLVTKVNRASDTLQSIYGGVPSEDAVLLEDIIFAAVKMITIANDNNRPIVILIPYGTNIDSHDGKLELLEVVRVLADRQGCSFVVPTGEEADKQHHQRIEFQDQTQEVVEIVVLQRNQNIVGTIWKNIPGQIRMTLFPPNDTQGISLDQPNISVLDEGRIIVRGNKISFNNGDEYTLFRIENPITGNWRIVIDNPNRVQDDIDIWISQYPLNRSVILNPSSAFISALSLACIEEFMSVGAYDKETLTIQRSSGRGFARDEAVTPTLVTDAVNVTAPYINGTWAKISGTMAAAAIMAGVAAVLYTKLIEEKIFPLANSTVMQNLVLRRIERIETVDFPNPSYGYGIFNLGNFNDILLEEFFRGVKV